jgi:hypothetical protein
MPEDYNFETFQRKKKLPRKTRSYRLSMEDIALLESLSEEMGLSHTSVIVTAIRDLAKRKKIEVKQ